MRAVCLPAIACVVLLSTLVACKKRRTSQRRVTREALAHARSVNIRLVMGQDAHPGLKVGDTVTLTSRAEIKALVKRMKLTVKDCMCTTMHTIRFQLRDGRTVSFNYAGDEAREYIVQLFSRKLLKGRRGAAVP